MFVLKLSGKQEYLFTKNLFLIGKSVLIGYLNIIVLQINYLGISFSKALAQL